MFTMLRGPSVPGSSTGFLIRWPCASASTLCTLLFSTRQKSFMDNTTSAPPGASSTISENIKGKDAEHSRTRDSRMSFRGRSVASVDLFGFPRRRKKEDLMYETAKQLMDTAIKAHMQMFGVDRETASYWIRSASDVMD